MRSWRRRRCTDTAMYLGSECGSSYELLLCAAVILFVDCVLVWGPGSLRDVFERLLAVTDV
jgi:hypothetical protein